MELKFTTIIQERLADENLSQISDKLEIPRSLLQDWVHNERKPSLANIEHVVSLSKYLGISLEELLLGTKTEQKTVSSITFSDDGREYRINIERIK
jgi:ribosome-binding protein aMBF1 (putative translation factor)